MWYLFYNGMLLSNKKEQSGVVCGGVGGPRYLVCQTERGQKEEKQVLYTIKYTWSLEKWYR